MRGIGCGLFPEFLKAHEEQQNEGSREEPAQAVEQGSDDWLEKTTTLGRVLDRVMKPRNAVSDDAAADEEHGGGAQNR